MGRGEGFGRVECGVWYDTACMMLCSGDTVLYARFWTFYECGNGIRDIPVCYFVGGAAGVELGY